ncbi:MAG: hypothetical protein HQL73_02005 [Magnetococcales bacterium]|nr:hypothetical protein [Magnetococcales bacterium]
MTTAHFTLSHILQAPSDTWDGPEYNDSAKGSSRVRIVWMVVLTAIVATTTYVYVNHRHMQTMKGVVHSRSVLQEKLNEATRTADTLREQLALTTLSLEEWRNKVSGSTKVIENLTVSRQALSDQYEQAKRQWQQDRKTLENQLGTVRQNGHRPSAVQVVVTAEPSVATPGALATDQILLAQAKGLQNRLQSGCVQGDCVNGQGAWHFDNGDIYVGTWINGLKDGQGLYRYASGAWYFGSWSQDLKHGHGVYHFANGWLYEGGWFKGKRNGLGVETSPMGQAKKGQWVDDGQVS